MERTSGSPGRGRAFALARRHSRHVRVLRIALPVCAIAIAGLYFLSSGAKMTIGDTQASISRVEISKDRLRMVDPKLEGVTGDNGTYKLRADYAEQEVGNTSLVHLHVVRADLDNAARGWTRLTSPRGLFDTKKQVLALTGDIKVVSDSGMTSHLTRADVDMKSQIVTSTEPVKVIFPDGHLDSRAMHIAMKSREISFLGDVRLRAMPKPKSEGRDASAADGEAGAPFSRAFASDQPVDIAAPRLTIYDGRKFAHFTGGVVTEQGGSRMTSRELKTHYADSGGQDGRPARDGQSMSGKLSRIEAAGDVRIETADGRTAAGATLVYDAASRRLVIDRDVTLTQGGSVLKGARMEADLAKSVTRFPPGGRVHGHFVPKQPDKAKPASGAPSRPQAVDMGDSQLDLSSARGKPVDVEADTLTVHDDRKEAVFDGNVFTRQGGMDMRSATLRVFYGGTGDGEGGAASISRVRAEGSVLITTEKDQHVTSDWALFESASRTVTIGGNVVLTQQENVIKGERLVIDLNTGRSRFEDQGNVATKGRVRMLFAPKKDAQRDKAKPAGN